MDRTGPDDAKRGPIKRSVMIAGHATSVTLEPIFWDALREAADADRLPLSALVARIDAERAGQGAAVNLASAIRVWLFQRLRADTVA
ncbi:ribbon-helix-helix domain-containing protein [Sphingomonas sp. BIUV-7]|uniref:Ribbon-helix-helix domain-containing protein n=1 Tax=Sphingomonas natans TaxID=3063330 RepID=A0ABT8YEH5_9SPHN|nr:ribbon-helix-helix domain-containing protein [Sphingomonas sp. BIUV-7]MDO6416734.1 ribbon-helix-helix domain-containing protein [Sphingomonas sp. BIUV-7]